MDTSSAASLSPEPTKTKIRVKVGHKNTEAVDPKFINTVEDWVSYSGRENVKLGDDGSLQVINSEGIPKIIQFQKGFDSIRGINMRSDLLRKKSSEHLSYVRHERKRTLSELQDQFVTKEQELLAATKAYREDVTKDADGSLASNVVKINNELRFINDKIFEAKYASITPVIQTFYSRAVIKPGSHDDRVIGINQIQTMESTALMRTLGLDGEPLKPRIEAAANNSNDNNNSGESNNGIVSNESSGNNNESGANNNESSGNNNESSGNNNESGGNNNESSSNESNSNNSSEGSESNSNNSSEGSESNSNNSSEGSESIDPYTELVNELTEKFDESEWTTDSTIMDIKALFTEERLAYYNARIVDFKKRFKDACLQVIQNH